jgi:hypothetical protein
MSDRLACPKCKSEQVKFTPKGLLCVRCDHLFESRLSSVQRRLFREYPDEPEGRPSPDRPDDHFVGSVIVMHIYGDDTYASVLPSVPGISLRNNFSMIDLPNGDIIYLAKTLDHLKANVELDRKELEALFNAGLIDADDEGNFII